MNRIIIICIVFAGLLITALSTSPKINAKAGQPAFANQSQEQQQKEAEIVSDPPGTIDGATNPEFISDTVAYALIFRLMADRNTEMEKRSIRAYVRQLGLGRQDCGSCLEVSSDDADIDGLLTTADEFNKKIISLDSQVKEIKDRTWPDPSPDVMSQLALLQGEKELIVNEAVASLPARLSTAGLRQIQFRVNQRIKPGIKMIPSVRDASAAHEVHK